MYGQKAPSMTSEERSRKVKQLFDHHKGTLEALGITNPYFYPKIPWTTIGMSEQGVGMYPTELQKGDTYVELIDSQYNPIDPKRTLYKVRQNQHLNEYIDNQGRLMVPISELIEIKPPAKLSTRSIAPSADVFEEAIHGDQLIERMTILDFTAIMLRKPVSQKQWLNKIVTS